MGNKKNGFTFNITLVQHITQNMRDFRPSFGDENIVQAY